jgi:hypothetical protein
MQAFIQPEIAIIKKLIAQIKMPIFLPAKTSYR